MPLWLIIGIGSFIGGILRYWISGWVQSGALTFPLGTLVVNFIGSFKEDNFKAWIRNHFGDYLYHIFLSLIPNSSGEFPVKKCL